MKRRGYYSHPTLILLHVTPNTTSFINSASALFFFFIVIKMPGGLLTFARPVWVGEPGCQVGTSQAVRKGRRSITLCPK